MCPPKPARMSAISLRAWSERPWLENRAMSAVVITGAGTNVVVLRAAGSAALVDSGPPEHGAELARHVRGRLGLLPVVGCGGQKNRNGHASDQNTLMPWPHFHDGCSR